MNKLFNVADQYIQESDWKVIALLKFCLISLGVIVGMQVAPKHRKPVLLGCLAVFIATYIPLMAKLLRLYTAKGSDI